MTETIPASTSSAAPRREQTPDALRYFCQSRFLMPELATPYEQDDDEPQRGMDYEEAMCGGSVSASYIDY